MMAREMFGHLLHLGTSSFTPAGWETSFYPRGMNSRDYLSFYATQFDTLEIDATFYAIPALSTVKNWYARTPSQFLFALKCPQEITHERVLVDVDPVFTEFLRAVEPLNEKLGVILLQFPYFGRNAFTSGSEFLDRLRTFLQKLPAQPRFAVEIRNKSWLTPEFFDVLRTHRVAFALVDHPWMPRPLEYFAKYDPITTDFTYIRWLGDRKEIESITKLWDRTIADRSGELREWSEICRRFFDRGIRVFGFANNHYGGHAPDTLRMVAKMLNISLHSNAPEPVPVTPKLFPDL